MASRESGRLKDASSKRILDESARRRRARKALEALEQDNFHDDPHANLVMSKKAPKFEESLDGNKNKDRKRRTRSSEYFKQRFRKNFTILLEEEQALYPDGPNYLTVQAPSSKMPERRLCAVCGFPAPYTCIPCGARYCSTKCLSTHEDTRCLKWTA
ncbi:zinc finger HIT domain-containing protein 1-like [Eriocheir sinensis]|uniref:zinc finger HIT domain-containing protein 1-like n=1 Tax=Eriocheir sinensis TaxID=95602 RepID=UPI0021C996B4|nr:zinc finger HIT domain-containing protein 1-like [Eriocheir sinensis]XP_050727683.1 zinc finger HIT domain-containing protein 1-like [Eriocheir sinensis]XP_050727834.1 zinc finger HIT domain-containing protein 1-like [Eriocheir sinensis]